MILSTTENIPGKNYEVLGIVTGSVVRTKHLGRDIMAGFRNLVGGEIPGYTELLIESRQIATDRMLKEAKNLNADAIVCLRYTTSAVMSGASESVAFGTAVKFV